MTKEIELKLSLAPDQIDTLLHQPLLANEAVAQGRSMLHNRYFDTPDGLLAANRVALRIREIGTRYIQTLKTRGASQGGLHQRNEWEWELATPELDYDRLAGADWPEALANTEMQRRIVPVFRTDFERSTWLLQRRTAEGDALIELALDRGEVVTEGGGASRIELCELELELKQGSPQVLFEAAMELAERVPLLVSDISKAERGYRLLGMSRGGASHGKLDSGVSVQEAFRALVEHALNRISRGFEGWHERSDWQDVEQAQRALGDLEAQLSLFAPVLPPHDVAWLLPALAMFRQRLDRPLAWRRLLPGMSPELASAWRDRRDHDAQARLEQVLQDPSIGQVLLGAGRLLALDDWPAEADRALAEFDPA